MICIETKRELAGQLDESTSFAYAAFRERLVRNLAEVDALIARLTREHRLKELWRASLIRGQIRAEIKHVDRCAKRSAKIYGGLSRG